MSRVLEFLKSIFGITSSFIKLPVVRADDDDDEEEELHDPQVGLRVSFHIITLNYLYI